VIAPCQPSVMDVWAIQSVIDTAKRLKTPLRILMNRMPPRIGTMEDVLAAMGDAQSHLLSTQLGNRIAFSQAVLTGRTAPELARRSTAAAEVEALRTEIDGLLAA
jgi:chromosome partitioning protein